MKKIIWRTLLALFLLAFVLINWLAYNHAYTFTHFVEHPYRTNPEPDSLNSGEKMNALIYGIEIYKPKTHRKPAHCQVICLRTADSLTLSGWLTKVPKAQGTVILFPGYASAKDALLSNALVFNRLGYHTLLVDFRGAGDSEGIETTIGYREAEDVRTAYRYIESLQLHPNIYLFGNSMGAAAILRALSEYQLQPTASVIECPFGSMLAAVQGRVRSMQLPTFPIAELLVFWGGWQNNYWAFGHQPTEYAKKVSSPTLLLYGNADDRVSPQETQTIYTNLAGKKKLKTFDDLGHEHFLSKFPEAWTEEVKNFLQAHTNTQ
ncbi:MAG: lysophospholipase [Microscillaceae bacterium]|jgi:hypothetical protein|nr:lysophospholipase [Microscillaceae bacterium]